MAKLEVKNQIFTIVLFFGLISLALFGLAHNGTVLPWSVVIIGCSLGTLIVALIYYNKTVKQKNKELNLMIFNLKKEMLERSAIESSKQKLEIALLQGQKLQSIGTLASGIAHDFNNILYAISGYTALIKSDIKGDARVYSNLDKIIDASRRGQDLISRILKFSRRQPQSFEIINLKNTIEAAISLLKPTVPASVIFETNLSELYIKGDNTQIHQVLVNLINNAVDAMHDEGRIKINLIKYIKDHPGKHFCKIEIIDMGHGMDQNMIGRIFEPFYTTKEVGRGTGLGLSIVHSIIKQHHGEISVTSQLGKGTTFTILIPEYVHK